MIQGFGNFQQTSGCALDYDPLTDDTIYDPRCIGVADSTLESAWLTWATINPWPVGFPDNYDFPIVNQSYYCSYGVEDDGSQTEGMGFCCPPDTRAEYDDAEEVWRCADFEECGVDGTLECKEDYRNDNWVPWIDEAFDGDDQLDWCVSYLPNYFSPLTDTFDRSMGCCFVAMYGKFGFYHNVSNVKIFGYE